MGELVAAGGEGGGAPGELVEFEQPSLVGIQQPDALALVAVHRGIEPSQLSGDQLVLVGRRSGDHGALARDQLPGIEQHLADLRPDVSVEFVGADVALGAATLWRVSAQDIMAATVVVTVPGAVAPAHAVTVATEVTVTALDQTAQEPHAPLRAARVPLRVVTLDLLDTVERVAFDDRRDRDRDPFFAGSFAVAGLAVARTARAVALQRLAAVVIDGPDVRLVVEQPRDRRGAPRSVAGRRPNPAVEQVKRDLPDRSSGLDVGVKDPPHDLGLGLEDLDPCRPTVGGHHTPVPV